MHRHRRILGIVLLLGLLAGPSASMGQSLVAFSLREAQRKSQAAERDKDLSALGGITRIVGMVHDSGGGDVILVGRVDRGLPAVSLDDLVVALRSRLIHDDWPTVSIDPTEKTAATRRQAVAFRAGIGESPYGLDFLACDIVLKKYSLGLLSPVPGTPSYRALCEQRAEKRIEAAGARLTGARWLEANDGPQVCKPLEGREIRTEDRVQIRFWFFPVEPFHFVSRDGVFLIRDLRLTVKMEVATDSNAPSKAAADYIEAGKDFVGEFTAHLPALCQAHPVLKRLKPLYDLVAVAEGIRGLKTRPDFDYLLKRHRIGLVDVPREFELIDLYGFLRRSDGLEQLIRVSGGVRFETEMKWLNEGDVSPLRTVVLKTRPAPDSLCWPLPMDQWKTPNAADLERPGISVASQPATSPLPAGCHVTACAYLLGPGTVADSDSSRKFHGFPPPTPPAATPAAYSPIIKYSQDLRPVWTGLGTNAKDMGGVYVDVSGRQKDKSVTTKAVDLAGDDILQRRPDSKSSAWKIPLPSEGVDHD